MPLGAFKLNSISKYLAPSGRTAKNITRQGTNPVVSTTQSKFGGASYYNATAGDGLIANYPSGSSDLLFAGDYTYECWVYKSTTPANKKQIMGQGAQWGNTQVMVYLNTSNQIDVYVGATLRITSSTTVSNNTWAHIAVSKQSGVHRLFVDGTLQGTTYTDSTAVSGSTDFHIGREPGYSAGSWTGYIDELRISNMARYTASFTPPQVAISNDSNTSLLIHFDGSNGSTTFTDDVSTPTYAFSASGGTLSSYTTGGKTYNVHTITATSAFTVVSGSGTVDMLLVGGGGSGGRSGSFGMGGGGGGGRVRYITSLNASNQSITIGNGGTSGASPTNGGSSTAFGYTSEGGGSGGYNATSSYNGASVTGGSGGGGGGTYTSAGTGGTGTYSGGNARLSNEAGGGGGGAGAAGSNSPSSGVGGAGGAGYGITDTFSSGTTYYGGGGGGGGYGSSNKGAGGSGGGGAGAGVTSGVGTGTAGTANTGGGGGGGYSNSVTGTQSNASSGGSGIVIIRYQVA